MTLTELPQVQALSARDKLALVDEIWASVGSDLESLEVTAEERAMLETRWSAFLSEPSAALTVDEFKDQVSALRA